MNEILFATDFSEASRYALRFATSLARGWHTGLLIVHVAEKECGPVGELFDEQCEPPQEEVERLAAVIPEDAKVPYRHHLIEPAPSSENVHPADELVKFAEHEQVQAIILGTHGRTGLSRVLAGSVAQAVMHQARCPVITVRQPHPEWAGTSSA